MLNYSEAKGIMNLNWLAVCRSWMNRDDAEGKAKKIKSQKLAM